MNLGGLNGGGHWGVRDSANSYVQYHLANGKSIGNSGSVPQTNAASALSRPIKQLFFISLAIGLCTFLGSGMNSLLAVVLAVAVSAVIALLPLAVIWFWLRATSKKRGVSGQ